MWSPAPCSCSPRTWVESDGGSATPFAACNVAKPASIVFERAGYSVLARSNRVAWDVSLMTVHDFHTATETPPSRFQRPSP
jgi:hypothetical protein